MASVAKRAATGGLRPFARFVAACAPLHRAWAHTRLATSIHSPLPPTVVVLRTPEVNGTGDITIGSHAYLYRDLYLETQGRGRVAIGDNVVLSRGVHIVAFESVEIGDDTLIGEYSSIRDANHRYGAAVGRVRDAGHRASAIRIGRNVWIGRGVTILGGVEIGDGAVIGANSVVTRSVPAGAVVAGAPAQPLHRRLAA